MKKEIQDAGVIVNGLPIAVSKLELRLVPDRVVRLSVPYAEQDKLTVAGVRCPGIDSPAVFTGRLNGVPVTGSFGGKLAGVKHKMRGAAFDLQLDKLELYWSPDEALRGDGKSEDAEAQAGVEPAVNHDEPGLLVGTSAAVPDTTGAPSV